MKRSERDVTSELKCSKCNKIIGFFSSKYYISGTFRCPSCYFDSWKSEDKI